MKRLLRYTILLVGLLVFTVLSIDAYVSYAVKKQVYGDIKELPHNRVGLVLGTSKYVSTGVQNLFYKYRIEAAVELYKAGKIDFILVSGDNREANYNEPATMKKDLVAAGIPERHIFLDYAGFRTLDSIIRSDAVFTAGVVTVISQRFHNERALFIANRRGIKAIAYNAQDPPGKYRAKVMLREKLARVKMVLDLLFNKQPKFFGDQVNIKDTGVSYKIDLKNYKAPSFEDYPMLDNDNISIKYLSKTVRNNESSDTRPYAEVCKDWTLNQEDVLGLLPHFKPINSVEWHHRYDVLQCAVQGTVLIDSVEYTFSINAGSYLSLSDGKGTYIYGCDEDNCEGMFLSSPWQDDEDAY